MADIFRKTYTPLSPEEKGIVDEIKMRAQELYNLLDVQIPTREIALAKTNLEQAVMWAVKSITE